MNDADVRATVERLTDFAEGVTRLCAHYYGSPSITICLYDRSLAQVLEDYTLFKRATPVEVSRRVAEFGAWVTAFLDGGGAISGEFERAKREHPDLFQRLTTNRPSFLRDLSRLADFSGAIDDVSNGSFVEVADNCVVFVGGGCDVHLD